MTKHEKIELLTRWIPLMPTAGLRDVIAKLEADSPSLIRRAFSDGRGGECLATIFGKHLPQLAGSESPGLDFLHLANLAPCCRVVVAWDSKPTFAPQILRVLKCERLYRRGGRSCRSAKSDSASFASC